MQHIFNSLDISEKESRVWITMLSLGPQPVSIIAKHNEMARSSVYVLLERLEKDNLIERFDRNGVTYFACTDLDTVNHLLEDREQSAARSLSLFEKSLPKLRAMENTMALRPRVRFFEGKNGVIKMYEEVLKEKGFYASFNPELVKAIMPQYVYKVAEELRVQGGRAKELLADCAEAHAYKKKFSSPKHEIKILPQGVDLESDTIVCSDKIYMIAYGKGQISATEITNSALAGAQRALFDTLWRFL